MEITKEYQKIILDHYKRVAKNNGARPTSSMGDQFIRRAEINFILSEIKKKAARKKKLTILECGHGNGHLLSVLKNEFPLATLYGVEFSPDLFAISKERQLENVFLENADVCKGEFFPELKECDVAITERVIINILDRPGQYQAISAISNRLKKGGLYIMVESFREPLIHLNEAREELNLPRVPIPPFNKYISEPFIEKCCMRLGLEELTTSVMSRHHLSSHFYLTRCVGEWLRTQSGGNPFDHFLGFLKQSMPVGIGQYSPILFRVFKRI